MRISNVVSSGLALALAVSFPTYAWQRHGGGQQGSATAVTGSDVTKAASAGDQQVYGWQLMTPAERDAYRSQMRSLHTQRERDALRMQHHEEMRKRAAEQGMTLPDMPHAGAGPRMRGGAGPGRGGMRPQIQQQTEQRTQQQTEQRTQEQPAQPVQQRTRQQTEQQPSEQHPR